MGVAVQRRMSGAMAIESPGHRMPRVVPFQWHDIDGVGDWRERLTWPVSMVHMRAIGERLCGATLTAIAQLDDELERHVAIVAAGRFVNAFMSLVEAAFVAQGEAEQDVCAIGGPPELAALRVDSSNVEVLEDRGFNVGVFDVKRANAPALRAVVRTATWTRWPRLPIALMFPEAHAISHNALLRHYAHQVNKRISYWPGANLLVDARKRNHSAERPRDVTSLLQHVVARLLPVANGLKEPWRSRFARLWVARLTPSVSQIVRDVESLKATRRLPRNLWTGTNGAYVNRLLSAEVLRRGGFVMGFDHGGVTGISKVSGLTAIGELLTVSAFCVGTVAWAALLERTDARALARPINRPTIIHADSDPFFRQACIDDRPRPRRERRVLYIGHPYRGLRQFPIVGTPDVIYWDLQSRVAEQLTGLPIDLLCKPHPEGDFLGRRNPIEDVAPTSYRPFEEHLAETDVFVFDAPTSTTFAEALCTNRPVVLIDRGHYPLNPEIEPHVRKRCRCVPSRVDADNRIWPDKEALEEAVLGGPDTADPSYFRQLLAGVGE